MNYIAASLSGGRAFLTIDGESFEIPNYWQAKIGEKWEWGFGEPSDIVARWKLDNQRATNTVTMRLQIPRRIESK